MDQSRFSSLKAVVCDFLAVCRIIVTLLDLSPAKLLRTMSHIQHLGKKSAYVAASINVIYTFLLSYQLHIGSLAPLCFTADTLAVTVVVLARSTPNMLNLIWSKHIYLRSMCAANSHQASFHGFGKVDRCRAAQLCEQTSSWMLSIEFDFMHRPSHCMISHRKQVRSTYLFFSVLGCINSESCFSSLFKGRLYAFCYWLFLYFPTCSVFSLLFEAMLHYTQPKPKLRGLRSPDLFYK